MASADGCHVPFCFCRQSSLSDARTETTTERVSGFSEWAVLKAAPSARLASVGWASEMATAMESAALIGAAVFSERTDIDERVYHWWSTRRPWVQGLLVAGYSKAHRRGFSSTLPWYATLVRYAS